MQKTNGACPHDSAPRSATRAVRVLLCPLPSRGDNRVQRRATTPVWLTMPMGSLGDANGLASYPWVARVKHCATRNLPSLNRSPLGPAKQTARACADMSALCQNRTYAVQQIWRRFCRGPWSRRRWRPRTRRRFPSSGRGRSQHALSGNGRRRPSSPILQNLIFGTPSQKRLWAIAARQPLFDHLVGAGE